jgi:hypothetical protein
MPMEETPSKVGRSYLAIRREEGKPDYPTSFPVTARTEDVVGWCESEGYKVLEHTVEETPADTKHIAAIIVTVQPKATEPQNPEASLLTTRGFAS